MEADTLHTQNTEEATADYRSLIRQAIASRRQVLVFELARRLHCLMRDSVSPSTREEAGGKEWIRIESLSQLRASVGGRFQNLKQRWVAAGFPLREHRGDRSEDALLDRDGWLELTSWIAKQGFESRLLSDGDEGIFEVRAVKEESGEK